MDKAAFGKAIVICGMSWLAIPVLYYMFKRKEKNDIKDEKNNLGKASVETESTSSRGSKNNGSELLLGNVDEKEKLLK